MRPMTIRYMNYIIDTIINTFSQVQQAWIVFILFEFSTVYRNYMVVSFAYGSLLLFYQNIGVITGVTDQQGMFTSLPLE
jgi:hypothetical protein